MSLRNRDSQLAQKRKAVGTGRPGCYLLPDSANNNGWCDTPSRPSSARLRIRRQAGSQSEARQLEDSRAESPPIGLIIMGRLSRGEGFCSRYSKISNPELKTFFLAAICASFARRVKWNNTCNACRISADARVSSVSTSL